MQKLANKIYSLSTLVETNSKKSSLPIDKTLEEGFKALDFFSSRIKFFSALMALKRLSAHYEDTGEFRLASDIKDLVKRVNDVIQKASEISSSDSYLR